MDATTPVYVVGAGAIGMPLAALLSAQGRPALAVRTSARDRPEDDIAVTVEPEDGGPIEARVRAIPLSAIRDPEPGILAVAIKATANGAVAQELWQRFGDMPLVVMQNGLGVERPFTDAGFTTVYRCVLYATGQTLGEHTYRFREVAESPVGRAGGNAAETAAIVQALSTPRFRFRATDAIQREAWKKAIINAAFNSICPLLDVDNGIFHRDEQAARIAETVVAESRAVAARLGIPFEQHELMAQLMRISQGSDGQLISTLQDIRANRETEIGYLNLEIARLAAGLEPPEDVRTVRVLGDMVAAKSGITRR
ncbi:hypothetical protein KBTX_01639 [wastewater metagenome]|uniref:2-dehydropantoate 2-reductase n=2 Tax=unclassified sequences TaxID=12908 RepID=A0A5B8R872_9ZZZZ|nr:ketopantoate reductase C-terminal domain-containing protein [Arhodomonas sp. KWT]QEA05319.1 hypothetical protein KBTEX_01639 [uncultured organism]